MDEKKKMRAKEVLWKFSRLWM